MRTGSAQTDREVLLFVYSATGGPSWTCQEGWAENADDLGSWFGVTVSAQGRVEKLELQGIPEFPKVYEGNNVCGNIPSELHRLDALKLLNISGNNIVGSIPSELGSMVALETLHLSYNELSGSIPSKICGMVRLQTLNLGFNKLTGSIPPELATMSALEWVGFGYNELTGSIPSALGGMVGLQNLYLMSNRLTGSIPPKLVGMVSLKRLDTNNNRLTGSIPSELGGMVSMERLDLQNNQLTGLVPSELGDMLSLQRLDLQNNQLIGLGDVEGALTLVQRFTAPTTSKKEIQLLLKGNPWVMPPEAVVEEGLSAVENYLIDVRMATEAGAQVTTAKLLKVVLVGSSQVGKTSLMNSIVQEKEFRTQGTPEEVSTVGIDLLCHRLKDIRVEFYDCAGQIDYAGMQQIFLSRRALYLLVWDATKCLREDDNRLDQVINEDIMSWLYALALRSPSSTVMLVANKCDKSAGDLSEVVQKVVTRVREVLSDWQSNRGIPGQVGNPIPTLNLLLLPSLVSCDDAFGLSDLIERIAGEGGTSISIPPSWDLALTVVDALRDKEEPLMSAREHLGLCSIAVSSRHMPELFMSRRALSGLWGDILEHLRESSELRTAAQLAAVTNAHSALKGALWISEFAGQILCVDGGEGIFHDVVLLSKVLSPIVDHKLKKRVLESRQLMDAKYELLSTGVLRCALARYLWREILKDGDGQPSRVQFESALFHVVVKLGVVLPLGRVCSRENDDGASATSRKSDGLRDMLVGRWMPLCLDDASQQALEGLLETKRQNGAQEVILRYEFDPAGPPQGMIGRLIASCHVIGDAESKLCWRSGAVFQSQFSTEEMGRLFVVELRYDVEDRVLLIRMFGPLESEKVWAALRFMASVMVNISNEWQGVRWAGSLVCTTHARDRVYLATPTEATVGSPLFPETRAGCDCLRNKRTIIGQAALKLGVVIDTRAGDPFESCPNTEEAVTVGPQIAHEARGLQIMQGIRHHCAPCFIAFRRWRASRTVLGLLTFCSGLVLTVVSLDSTPTIMWKVCAGVVIVLLVAAWAAAYCCAAQTVAGQQGSGNESV